MGKRFALWVALLFGFAADAKVVGLLDFDGTIVEDRGAGSAWITPWLLKRVDQLHSTAQQAPNEPVDVTLPNGERTTLDLPDQVKISYGEFLRIQAYLAKGEAALGGLHPVELDADPIFPGRKRWIVPGYYRTYDLTFKYYRESTGTHRQNFLLKNLQQARARSEALGPGARWQGLAFPIFRKLMANPDTVQDAIIFTSRGHGAAEYQQAWDDMQAHGEIAHARGAGGEGPKVYSMSRPEARILGRTLGEKKVEVLRHVLESLFHTPGRPHTLIVAEDEPSYVDALAQFMLNMSGGYYADRVELVLLNTGSEDEVRHARFPMRWTRFSAGRRVREVNASEIARWTTADCAHDLEAN